MRASTATLFFPAAPAAKPAARESAAAGLIGTLQNLLRDLASPYRPERHYMRGPGPACRAKQRQGVAH